MPPKQRISKQDIINAGFELLKTEGIENINARAICKKLNCSTQPIFSQFATMEELKQELKQKARDLYNGYIQQSLKEKLPFKASGMAYIRFAKDYPKLFSLLFMNDNKGNVIPSNKYDQNYNDVLTKVVENSDLNTEQSEVLYFHLWIYVHGIATNIATNSVSFTDSQISEMLTVAYNAFLKSYK